jgi:DnaJ-class molecular chaperone
LKNYYEILGVKRTSGEKEINRRTYELGKSLHPKKGDSKVLDTKKFEEIIEAHSVISDTETKEVYDWVLDHELGNKQLRDVALSKHRRELEVAINHGTRRGRSYAKEPFWAFKDDFSSSGSFWNLFSLWPF